MCIRDRGLGYSSFCLKPDRACFDTAFGSIGVCFLTECLGRVVFLFGLGAGAPGGNRGPLFGGGFGGVGVHRLARKKNRFMAHACLLNTSLEEGCWIGPCVVLTNAKYPCSPEAKKNLKGPTVRRGAKIGANSTLLPGVVVGEGALVGAGSVVVRDVAPHTVVAGSPARFIKNISDLPYRSKK